MTTVKKQIELLIQSYKDNFRSETGLNLIVFADTAIEGIELEKLKEYTESIMNIKMERSNKPDQVKIRKFMVRIGIEMGYTDREIVKCIKVIHRTSISHYRTQGFKGSDKNEKEFAKFKQELLKRIQ